MRMIAKVALLALMTIAAQPAAAAVVVATYTGTVLANASYGELFGKSGESLDGETFTAVYTADDPVPGVSIATDPGATIMTGIGFINAVLTINGVSYNFSSAQASRHERLNGVNNPGFSGLDKVLHSVGDVPGTSIFNYFESLVVDFVSTTDFAAPLSYSGFLRFGNFRIGGRSEAVITPGSVVIAVSPAVPEPTSWLFMIAGFAAVGVALRRARSAGKHDGLAVRT